MSNRLKKFWKLLENDASRTTVMFRWKYVLGEALSALQPILLPTGELVENHPNPNDPEGRWLLVVDFRNGKYCAISENREINIPLKESDIRCHKLNMERFRDMIAKTLGITPVNDPLGKYDQAIRLGQHSLFPGEIFPVYAVLADSNSSYQEAISSLLLTVNTPFLFLTGTRDSLPINLTEIVKNRKILFLPLCEALEFQDGQFVPTDAWHGVVESFRKMLHSENLVAVPEYEFARRGGWSLRFGFEKKEPTVLPGDLLGAFYIQRLLMFPHKEIHVTMLLAEIAGDDQLRVAMDGQEVIDQQARQNYMRRLEELAADRYEAERNEDESWLERVDRETDQITDELLKSTGLGGKTRKLGDDIQNIRRRIAKTINEVIEKINENDSQLARHLKNSIHTNIEMCYRPDREIAWVFN